MFGAAQRRNLAFVSTFAAGLGIILMLIDLWMLLAVKASVYRLWPGKAHDRLTDAWLWLGVLPLVALLLLCIAYWLRRDRNTSSTPKPARQ